LTEILNKRDRKVETHSDVGLEARWKEKLKVVRFQSQLLGQLRRE